MIIQDFRKTAPLRGEISSVKLPTPEVFSLDNGIKVYLLNSGTEEMMKVDVTFEAGVVYQEQPLVAHFTSKCLIEGTEKLNASEIAEQVDFYGAHLDTINTMDNAQVSLYCLNKYLENLLPVMQEVVLRPVFPEEQINTIIAKSREEFLVKMEKVDFIAQQAFQTLAFGKGHPYSSSIVAQDYDKVNSELLRNFFRDHYFQGEIRLFVSGKLPKNTDTLLNQYFGAHPIFPQSHQVIIPATHHKPVEEFIPKENAIQSAIQIGKLFINKLHPDYHKVKIMNTLLGGYFGSRLMANIREDKGYTYGIRSILLTMLKAGMFFISAQVGANVTQKAVDEVTVEIERLRNELVEEEELNLVKNYILGSFLRSADGPFAMAELVKGVVEYGLEMDFYNNFVKTIKNITPEEIKQMAVKYLQPESLIKVVVGKK